MKHRFKVLISIIFSSTIGLTQGQENVLSTGTDVIGSGGSVSYSIGQIGYQSFVGSNGSITEGVQQPYEISIVTAIEEAGGINLLLNAYPNPTSDNITLKVENIELSSLYFQLFDVNGKLIRSERIVSRLTRVKMINLSPAIYFIKVYNSKNIFKTFKINKH